MNNTSNIKEKREELKAISKPLAALKDMGLINTVNEGLKSIYLMQGHSEFKTLEQWEKAGKRVNKGSKAFYLWGKQTEKNVVDPDTGEEIEVKFFPLVALFSNNQVYTPKNV